MTLLKDLGKRVVGNYKRRYGLFKCPHCEREVERRIDQGEKKKTCGCVKQPSKMLEFNQWKCTRCEITKPLTEYYKRTDIKGSEYMFRRECKLCVKEKQLINKFGVTLKWYTKKLDEQGNVCDICKKHFEDTQKKGANGKDVKFFCVDHNHSTGEVRGLLCNNCNRALGLLGDSIKSLSNAVDYLIKYN